MSKPLATLVASIASKSASGDSDALRRVRAAKAAYYVQVALRELLAATAVVEDCPRPATLVAASTLEDDLAVLIGDLTAPPTLIPRRHEAFMAALAAETEQGVLQ